ncbi:universal stress protein [Halegenticoccus tardaugens]|uniref:universal stress protein n=1 Tax=Halegenticoccus tardaugens TaxID=2071624 RepID=UPI00100A86DA|nr:universal stress protein [Halegenticoccus tardaugens]
MYERILIPTDGSDAAESAVERAVDLAAEYGATLHALYVVDTAAYGTVDVNFPAFAEELEKEGERAVERVAEAAAEANVPVETEVTPGSPERVITKYVREHDIDLVVMGTHGRRGLERYLLGSVTARVVRTSDAPVLTVRYHPDE